ncbi:MAG: bifunctional adenosylcobinamide kinase/adenosylcobinamide-phosphate guanylyltransferase [Caldilineaceae bacterium]|nr:bifunctional adenosylcobinamide kinase/adenosylcobinamide-phosphate guanylyltransferase [Caldilineaceae bacterium]MDE0339387.1 bifunctional adenosylcobinamide kinase/adenosylcobinamide-phosphate guanylyltransferase [Caldilineaceae bacterium]
MGDLILILGGARSGKSAEAVRTASERTEEQVLFVATAEPGDDEMRLRIEKHRAERPAHWHTLEAPSNVGRAISGQSQTFAAIVVDCITLLVSNLLVDRPDPYAEEVRLDVDSEIAELLNAASEMPDGSQLIVVSNEVGAGMAPLTPLGRAFRDLVGHANQTLAAAADRAVLMVAGLPLILKGEAHQNPESVRPGSAANVAATRDE